MSDAGLRPNAHCGPIARGLRRRNIGKCRQGISWRRTSGLGGLIIQCGFSLAIAAIDENKSLSGDSTACSYSLLPGRHVFRVSIAKKEFGLYPGTYRQQGDQVVEYDLVAGKTYSLHAFEDEKSPGLWRINMIDPVVDRFVTLKEVRLVGAKAGG